MIVPRTRRKPLRPNQEVWVAACALLDGVPMRLVYLRPSQVSRRGVVLLRPDVGALVAVHRRYVHHAYQDAANHA